MVYHCIAIPLELVLCFTHFYIINLEGYRIDSVDVQIGILFGQLLFDHPNRSHSRRRYIKIVMESIHVFFYRSFDVVIVIVIVIVVDFVIVIVVIFVIVVVGIVVAVLGVLFESQVQVYRRPGYITT